MKKALRIVLLVLAVIAFGLGIFMAIDKLDMFNDIAYIIQIDPSLLFKCAHVNKDGFQLRTDAYLPKLVDFSIYVMLSFFAFLYIFFTFKNGLGKEIYHYAYLTIEEIRNKRDKKRKEDIKNTINELNEELETLENNTKSD